MTKKRVAKISDEVGPGLTYAIARKIEGNFDDVIQEATATFALTARLPHYDVAWLDALASKLKQSRNATFHTVILVARQALEDELSEEGLAALAHDQNERYRAMLEDE